MPSRSNPEPLILDKARPVHFIGVGGVGMSALAKILLEQGFRVSGSDAKESSYLTMLRELGGNVSARHHASQVPGNAIVVLSSAITPENEEVRQAEELKLPLYHRSDLLREILKRHEVAIGITGTHGKTTITGMTGLVLEEGGLEPTIVGGGKILKLHTNAKAGKDCHYAVAELDESDGTVTQYQPAISVIANLELDHPDHYQGGLDAVRQTFRNYLDALQSGQRVLFNMDCPVTRELYPQYAPMLDGVKVYPESIPEEPDNQSYFLRDVAPHTEGGYQGELYQGHERLGMLWLQIPGRHNLGNAMFAAIIGHRLGIPFDAIQRAIENFTGIGRRFERLGHCNGACIVDDYAHHPTEIKATLQAAREFNRQRGRVIAMFQPHRYQRFQALWEEFQGAFSDADEVIVTDVYAAGEPPLENVTSERFAQSLNHPAAEYWPSSGDWGLVVARLKTILTPGDLLITMGAGDITQVGRTLVNSP